MTSIMTYEQMKNLYNDFKKDPPKDSYSKYVGELQHLRLLINTAKLKGLDEDVFNYQKSEQVAIDNLEKMGYKIKS